MEAAMELPPELRHHGHRRTPSVSSTQSATAGESAEPKRGHKNISEFDLGARTAAGVAEDSRNVLHTNSELTDIKMSTKQFKVKKEKKEKKKRGVRRNTTSQ